MQVDAYPAGSDRREYRPLRRKAQLAGLALFVLIPASGIFRIDLADASVLLLGRHVYLRDFLVVAGLAVIVATAPLLTYSTIGTIWCGWLCPQNTLSEWANDWTHRLLGSRANVNVESAGLQVAPSKNRVRNWIALIARLAGVSLVLGIVPLLYFFPPQVVWSLFTFDESQQFSGFIYRLYLVAVLAVFVDVAVFRHFWCNYLCPYRYGQLLFKTEDALHIVYDEGRAAECARCNYCRVSCVTGIDPTRLKFFDRCIDCGECIDACVRLHAKDEPPTPGLLRFEQGRTWRGHGRARLVQRALAAMGLPGLLFLCGCGLLLAGMLRAGH